MERTGGTRSTNWFLAILTAAAIVAAVGACGGETNLPDDGAMPDRPIDSIFDPPIDGPPIDMGVPIDAPIDAAGCGGNDVLLQGYYLDWDSTLNNPLGIGESRWSVIGQPTRMAEVAPSGTISMCISAGAISQVSVSGPGAPPNNYVAARFVADPAVFVVPNTRFIVRGVKAGMATDQYHEFLGMSEGFNTARAHVMVYNLGPPIPLALMPVLNPPQRSFVSGGNFNDITWTEGAMGKLTLFPNRPTTVATATLSSTSPFAGPTEIPLLGGAFTIVVIRAQL